MADLKKQLLDKYKYRFELHAHSNPASPCSDFSPEELVDKFIECGYDGIVLTNHFQHRLKKSYSSKEYADLYLKDYEAVKKRAGDKLTVCLGMEIRFWENDNDYLVYGINEDDVEKCAYYLDKGIRTFYNEFKNDKNLILQAHPFRDGIILAPVDCIDGIEVFNLHAGHNSRIATAAQYAKQHNMILSGGIDFHHEYQSNQSAVRFQTLPKNSYDIAEIIKNQDMIFTVSDSIILP